MAVADIWAIRFVAPVIHCDELATYTWAWTAIVAGTEVIFRV
jgi:hypothetical protein